MLIIGFIIFIFVLYISFAFNGEIIYYTNLQILLSILGFNISVIIGTKSLNDLKYVCSFLIKGMEIQDNEKVNRGINILNLLFKITLISGVIGVIIVILSLLRELTNPSAIGPYTSSILLYILYSLIIAFFGILPSKYLLEKQKIDK